MTSEVDLEVNMEVLPAEPRRSCGELFFSQLSVSDTIQACKIDTQRGCVHLDAIPKQVKMPYICVFTGAYALCITQTVFVLLKISAADASILATIRLLIMYCL